MNWCPIQGWTLPLPIYAPSPWLQKGFDTIPSSAVTQLQTTITIKITKVSEQPGGQVWLKMDLCAWLCSSHGSNPECVFRCVIAQWLLFQPSLPAWNYLVLLEALARTINTILVASSKICALFLPQHVSSSWLFATKLWLFGDHAHISLTELRNKHHLKIFKSNSC